MNCRKASNYLSAYIDGELPGVEQLQIREHLRHCACCQEEYDALLMTKRLVSGLRIKEPRAGLEDRILTAIAKDGDIPSAGNGWLVRARAWWAVMAYSQRLRLAAGFCAASLAVAAIAVSLSTPRAGESIATANPASIATGITPLPDPKMPASTLINLHDPAENGPPSSGPSGIVPVSSQEFEPLGR